MNGYENSKMSMASQAASGLAQSNYGIGAAMAETQKLDSLQVVSNENTDKLKRVNQQLAAIRGRMFGECESSKDLPSPANAPMHSLQGSLSIANDELLEAFRQLDSIMSRL